MATVRVYSFLRSRLNVRTVATVIGLPRVLGDVFFLHVWSKLAGVEFGSTCALLRSVFVDTERLVRRTFLVDCQCCLYVANVSP